MSRARDVFLALVVVAALAYRQALGRFGWARRHYRLVMQVGGAMLVVLGVLLVTGLWDSLAATLRGSIAGFTPAV